MQNLSYWESEFLSTKTDFTIIGAGLVGLNCALFLKRKFPNADINLLEKGRFSYGASSRNAGFACFGTVGELMSDLNHVSESQVWESVRRRYAGLQLLREQVGDAHMDYSACGGTEVFGSELEFEEAADQVNLYNEMISEMVGLSNTFQIADCPQPFRFNAKAIHNGYEGQLNPGKLVRWLRRQVLKEGMAIFDGADLQSWARSESGYRLDLGPGFPELETYDLIFATNAYTSHLDVAPDIIPYRNQVLLSSPLPGFPEGTYHYDKGYVYFRNVGERVLIGGARNLDPVSEQTAIHGHNKTIQSHLIEFAQQNIHRDFNVEREWSGVIATGKEKNPIIKRLPSGPLLAVRLGGMGVAISTFVAHEAVTKLT